MCSVSLNSCGGVDLSRYHRIDVGGLLSFVVSVVNERGEAESNEKL